MADHAVPNLPSRDLDVTTAFYGGFGFEPIHRDDSWLILRRRDLRLEFFLFTGLVPDESSFMCSIRVDDVDELYGQITQMGVTEKAAGAPRLHPIRMQDWGQRAGFLVDPDGTQLHLIENVGHR